MSDLRVFLRAHGVPVRQSNLGQVIWVAVRGANTLAVVYYAVTDTTAALTGTFVAGLGSVAATAVGGWVALGSGYYAARKNWRNENFTNGFVVGFASGLLGWSGRQVAGHFGKWGVVRQNAFDGQMDVIEVRAYDEGLRKGYDLAVGLSDADRKSYLSQLRHSVHLNVPSRESWSYNTAVQDNYVNGLAMALRLKFVADGPMTLR